MLRLAPALTLALLLGPVLAGLVGTLLPSLGYLPALGGETFSLEPWRALLATPGLLRMAGLSLSVGLLATAVSLVAVVLICAAFQGTPAFSLVRRSLSPLLAVPHAALAIGFAFLIAPSGLAFRLLSPWATGLTRPPDLLVAQDPYGLALAAGLILKETPFLFLMTLAALPQADAARTLTVARTLGYGRVAGWLKAVLPRVYPQIRLPVLAVLAYSLSVVDVALVLGPTTPPTLSVQIVQWANDPDLALRFRASAGAVLQLLLTAGAVALWLVLERVAARLGRAWAEAGARRAVERAAPAAAAFLAGAMILAVVLSIATLALWSVAAQWRFPDDLPAVLTLDRWRESGGPALAAVATSASVAAAAALLALALALGCLEHEVRFGRRPSNRALVLLYLPLLVPQIAFILGMQVLFLAAGLDGSWPAVVFAHLIFVLPYVFLSLADPWRAFDDRYRRVALALGASPGRALWAVRLPMLLRAALTAGAVGFAVSVGQYLPTLLIGAGRLATITTEAVALSAGADRRIVGVYALMQMALPWAGFLVALALPALIHRRRRGLAAA